MNPGGPVLHGKLGWDQKEPSPVAPRSGAAVPGAGEAPGKAEGTFKDPFDADEGLFVSGVERINKKGGEAGAVGAEDVGKELVTDDQHGRRVRLQQFHGFQKAVGAGFGSLCQIGARKGGREAAGAFLSVVGKDHDPDPGFPHPRGKRTRGVIGGRIRGNQGIVDIQDQGAETVFR